jgi:hypothetical protein
MVIIQPKTLKELHRNKDINKKIFLQKCGNLRPHIIGVYKRDALSIETASVEGITGSVSPFLNEYSADEGYDSSLSFSIYWTGVFQQDTHSLVS